MHKVSVIIPAYNSEKYLQECLESVVSQTFADFEVIVVEDGSHDAVRKITESINDDRIRYIWKENGGSASARNLGISLATGKYIAFLDADDTYLPEKLEKQANFLDIYPEIGGVASGWYETDEKGKILREAKPWERKPILDLETWIVDCPVITSSVMVRRVWLDRVGSFDVSIDSCEDWDLWLRLAKAGCKFEWQTGIVCSYRFHSSNKIRDAKALKEPIITMFEKFFQDPALPQDILMRKQDAYFIAHMHTAGRGYMSGDFELGNSELKEAIKIRPDILIKKEMKYPFFITCLSDWAVSSLVRDPIQFLHQVSEHLPENYQSARREIKKLSAEFSLRRKLELIYTVYPDGDFRKIRRLFPSVIWEQPSLLLNRGFIKMMIIVFMNR